MMAGVDSNSEVYRRPHLYILSFITPIRIWKRERRRERGEERGEERGRKGGRKGEKKEKKKKKTRDLEQEENQEPGAKVKQCVYYCYAVVCLIVVPLHLVRRGKGRGSVI